MTSKLLLRTAHRAHAGLTICVLATLLTLNLTGSLTRGQAFGLFLTIEIPLFLMLAVLTVLRFKAAPHTPDVGVLDRLAAEEPLLRPAVYELRAFGSLGLLIARRPRVPSDAVPVGYTKGTLVLPTVLVVVSLIELAVVHLLVPWLWLQIILAVLTIWGVLFICGFFAGRIIHPHFIIDDVLTLRWGHRTVLSVPLANIRSALRHCNPAYTYPYVDGDRLVLTWFQTANVRIRFTEPVPADAPVSAKHRPEGFRASAVDLYVDDPDEILRRLKAAADQEKDHGYEAHRY